MHVWICGCLRSESTAIRPDFKCEPGALTIHGLTSSIATIKYEFLGVALPF